MQLRTGGVRRGLAAASCALLGASGTARADDDAPWQVDTGLLYYHEAQGRVQTVEPVVSLRHDYGDEHVLDLRFSYDSLTGGSPNGAIPAKKAQTFATPSGSSLQASSSTPVTYTNSSGQVVTEVPRSMLYTVAAGQLPLDPTFHDRRIAGDVGWTQPLGASDRLTVGGHLSHELDFRSVGVNAGLAHDFPGRNTTVSLGLNGEFDAVLPIYGAPVPGSDYTQLEKTGDKRKHVVGGVLGLTQVVNRFWLMELDWSYDRSGGYLTDPYKIVSVVNATGDATGYRFESRPDARSRQSLYLGNRLAFAGMFGELSYRRGRDDWGSRSDTVEGRIRFRVAENLYLEPHARWYRQSAADFYRLYLNSADALPEYLSADPRLAAFSATTVGAKLGFQPAKNQEISLRIEQYRQRPAEHTSSLALLQGLDLNPGLRSTIVQFGWRFEY